jgi:hypothetical protein
MLFLAILHYKKHGRPAKARTRPEKRGPQLPMGRAWAGFFRPEKPRFFRLGPSPARPVKRLGKPEPHHGTDAETGAPVSPYRWFRVEQRPIYPSLPRLKRSRRPQECCHVGALSLPTNQSAPPLLCPHRGLTSFLYPETKSQPFSHLPHLGFLFPLSATKKEEESRRRRKKGEGEGSSTLSHQEEPETACDRSWSCRRARRRMPMGNAKAPLTCRS